MGDYMDHWNHDTRTTEDKYPQDRNWIKNPPTGALGPAPFEYKNDKNQAVGQTKEYHKSSESNSPYRWANGEPAYVQPPVEEDVPNDGTRICKLYRYKLAKEILTAEGLTEFVEAIEYLNPFNEIKTLEERVSAKVIDALDVREEALKQKEITQTMERWKAEQERWLKTQEAWREAKEKSLPRSGQVVPVPRESSASFIDRFVAAVKGL